VREVMPRAILKESIVCYKAILGPVIIVLKKLGLNVDKDVVGKIMRKVYEAEKNVVVTYHIF
jgi:hypothetical protein